MANMINPRTGLPMTDAEQSDWARAQGSAAGAGSSLAANTAQGVANNQASAGAAANASNGISNALGPGGRILTPAEMADRARAYGSAAGANSSLGAATQVGQANQRAGAGAMNTASNMAAYRASGPMPGIQAPQAGAFNTTYNTWQNAGQYANPYAFNLPQTPGAASFGGAAPYMDPNAMNIPNGQGISGQNGTLANIQPYLNPYLDQIIQQGTNAISHSGAAKGLFGSTGNINDIGTFATNAASQAYGDAFNRFNTDRGYQAGQEWNRYGAGVDAGNQAYGRYADDRNFQNSNAWRGYDAGTAAGADALNRQAADRGYMTDQYWKGRDADTSDYWNTYNANWNQFKYGDAAYNGLLSDYYGANKDITGAQQGAADTTGGLYAALGNALAGIYGDSGNAAAAGGVAGSNANRGFIGSLLGLLGGM